MNYRSEIKGLGKGFPERIMTNQEFETFLKTSDEWIRTRTGISTRRICDPKKGETTASLSILAAKQAMEMAGLKPEDIGMIVVGTVTPDSVMPCTANTLQEKLGAINAFTFDLQAACSGFLYALSVADKFIRCGEVKHAIVVGAETLSTMVDWRDRGTCILFGDGAGAAVLSRTESDKNCIVDTLLFSDGTKHEMLNIRHGYSKVPTYSPEYREHDHKIRMQGSEVFKLAVRSMLEASEKILVKNNKTIKDVDFFIFHQANIRIIDMCLDTLKIPPEKTWLNVDKYGNTSAATLPVCLLEAWQAGKVKKGDLVLMSTFGGGVTWASSLIRL